MKDQKSRLPAEWEPQDGVLLCWPYDSAVWENIDISAIQQVFVEIAKRISFYEKVLLITQERNQAESMLMQKEACLENITFIDIASNDSWTRDCGPISVYRQNTPVILDFGFNGWGLKYAANYDNQITHQLLTSGAFHPDVKIQTIGMILEGGSIETDGKGSMLTTTSCLLSPNRNPHLTKEQIENQIMESLGIEQIHWLVNGYLVGDDTDGHIDTLVRFAPNDTILYVSCYDPEDPHFPPLSFMEKELRNLRTPKGKSYTLQALPLPDPKFDKNRNRLPATYANFLVINGAVLVPTYEDPNDEVAMTIISECFPDRLIFGINCLPLIHQYGSLHCITMQLPKGVLP